MALNVLFNKYHNKLVDEDIIVPRLVNQETMEFQKFCEVIADGSFASAADIGMVMMLIESKLPDILSLNMRVVCSPDGLTFVPKVSGSLSQKKLRARLKARQAAKPDLCIDVDRDLSLSDITVYDLEASIGVELPKKWNERFMQKASFKRVNKH